MTVDKVQPPTRQPKLKEDETPALAPKPCASSSSINNDAKMNFDSKEKEMSGEKASAEMVYQRQHLTTQQPPPQLSQKNENMQQQQQPMVNNNTILVPPMQQQHYLHQMIGQQNQQQPQQQQPLGLESAETKQHQELTGPGVGARVGGRGGRGDINGQLGLGLPPFYSSMPPHPPLYMRECQQQSPSQQQQQQFFGLGGGQSRTCVAKQRLPKTLLPLCF